MIIYFGGDQEFFRAIFYEDRESLRYREGFPEELRREQHKGILVSFYKWKEIEVFLKRVKDQREKEIECKCSIMLDSGAYSAWTKKEKIDIEKYIDFCFKWEKEIDICVNLDRIPGRFGEIPGDNEKNQSAEESLRNFFFIRNCFRGSFMWNRLMPVFHQGEDFRYLKKMMDETDYIGISPGNDRTVYQRKVWLERVFKILRGRKSHGFGVMSFDLLKEFPWFSVDAISPIIKGRFGSIYLPSFSSSEGYRYDGNPYKIDISLKKGINKNHFLFANKREKEFVEEYLLSFGYTVEEVLEEYRCRDIMNLSYFLLFDRKVLDGPKALGEKNRL